MLQGFTDHSDRCERIHHFYEGKMREIRFRALWLIAIMVPLSSHTTLTSTQSRTPASSAAESAVEEEGWPREVKVDDATFTVHQPQLDSWDGHNLAAFAAIEVRIPERENPFYGAAFITARTAVDKLDRMVELRDIQVTKAIFPSWPDKESEYLKILQDSVVYESRLIALDRFEAALAIMEANDLIDSIPLKNDPPHIILSSEPAIQIYIDGRPAYQPIKSSKLQRVMNTRPLVLKDSSGKHYLHLFDGWVEATGILGPWTVSRTPCSDLEQAKLEAVAGGQVDLLEGPDDPEGRFEKPSLEKGPVPRIYIATSPTELIVTEGEPKFVPIRGTSLLFAQNTTGHIFKHSSENRLYLLISGRWFRSSSRNGPWEFVPGGSLPRDFANIPDDSPKENVKAPVPDTQQAMEAVIAGSIPQMATINRQNAKLTPPQFDGEPKFEPIEGGDLAYAVNTATPIIKTRDAKYYAVENGVWFTAASLEDSWVVVDSIPTEIYTIPPDSPLHYVTYVRIYGSTKESIDVGYTSGYHGAYITRGSGFVMVYGTGYPYTPWVGSVWFGTPVTYGFGCSIAYTPWSGWTFSFGFGWHWGYPMVPAGWGWGPHPWWGPVGWGHYYPYPYYRPPYVGVAWDSRDGAVWGPGTGGATTGNVYHRWGTTTAVTGTSQGHNAWTGDRWANQVGMSYNSRTGNIAAGQRAAVGNVYTEGYAYGKRGVVTDAETGRTLSGGKVNVDNARTGESGSAGLVRGEQGSAMRIGDNIYAGEDGTVYRCGEGGWEQNNGSGWNPVNAAVNRDKKSTPQGGDLQAGQIGAVRQAGGTRITRSASPGRNISAGSASDRQMPSTHGIQSLERQRSARSQGQIRTLNFRLGSSGGAQMRRRR